MNAVWTINQLVFDAWMAKLDEIMEHERDYCLSSQEAVKTLIPPDIERDDIIIGGKADWPVDVLETDDWCLGSRAASRHGALIEPDEDQVDPRRHTDRIRIS
jgi:hypothetical protein